MQLGLVSGGRTTDAIFVVCQLQYKYIATNKLFYFAFLGLEKACDCVPRKVLWLALRGLGSRNGLCVSSKACIPMLGVVCRSMVGTVRRLGWELVCIRVVFPAHCSSFWCWRRFCVSFALVYHGSLFTLMTRCSSQTPRRSVSPSSRHGRLVGKVKGSVSTWTRPSSWSLLMAMMSSRNLACTPVLSAVVVVGATPSCAHSVWCGSTRSLVTLLNDWFLDENYVCPR